MSAEAKPRPNRGWMWYFGVLGVLSVVAVVVPVVVLARLRAAQQLTPEKLDAARALWKEKGPRDYDMEYTQSGSVSETRKVRVRNGKVVSAISDGRPLEDRLYRYSDMSFLFQSIADFLREDAEPGKPRVFSRATFDSEDGHLVHYIRSVMGTTERLEITVQLSRRAPEG